MSLIDRCQEFYDFPKADHFHHPPSDYHLPNAAITTSGVDGGSMDCSIASAAPLQFQSSDVDAVEES